MADLAAGQHGVVTRQQLLDLGIPPRTLDQRLAASRLHRLYRGVYAVGHEALPPLARETAALLACGDRALLSDWAAARLWALPARGRSEIDVTVVGRRHDGRPGIRIHRTASLHPNEVRTRHGLPVTSPARTLLDLAAHASAHELEKLLAEAHARRRVTRDQLLHLLSRHARRRGTAVLRRLVHGGETLALTRSEAERRLLTLIRRSGLPAPSVNARVIDYEVDFLWPGERLIVEVDGFAFHSSRLAFERDRRRDARLTAAGYRVLRLSWRQIVNEPEETLVGVAQALVAATAAA